MTQSDCQFSGLAETHKDFMTYDRLSATFCSTWTRNCNIDGENVNLKKIVECYSGVINSNREKNKIKTMKELLELLERRDELSEYNVKALECIRRRTVMLLTGGEKWTFDLKRKIECYKKQILKNAARISCVCGAVGPDGHKEWIANGRKATYEIPFHVLSPPPSSIAPYDIKEDLNHVLREIGKDWKKFVRELPGFTEADLNAMRSKYGENNSYTCFCQCLKHWQESASKDLLTRKTIILALKKCTREDVASTLPLSR